MSRDGQGTKWRRNIAENFHRLSRLHERYRRQTTDGRATAYSEHEREVTFAKKWMVRKSQIPLRYLLRSWLMVRSWSQTGSKPVCDQLRTASNQIA